MILRVPAAGGANSGRFGAHCLCFCNARYLYILGRMVCRTTRPSLGQTRPVLAEIDTVPGTNWPFSVYCYSVTGNVPSCPVCPWDRWGSSPHGPASWEIKSLYRYRLEVIFQKLLGPLVHIISCFLRATPKFRGKIFTPSVNLRGLG